MVGCRQRAPHFQVCVQRMKVGERLEGSLRTLFELPLSWSREQFTSIAENDFDSFFSLTD